MSVFENRRLRTCVTLAGKGDARAITGSEIDFGKKGSKIWVAVLEGPGMWHAIDVGAANAGKIMPLNWKMPYAAQWRVDFTRKGGLTDSWDMLLAEKEGNGFVKPSWLAQDGKISAANRTKTGEIDDDAYHQGWIASDRVNADRDRWTTVLGWVTYPCWSDRAGKGFLQPLKHEKLSFDGPVVMYPITRLGGDAPITRIHAVGCHARHALASVRASTSSTPKDKSRSTWAGRPATCGDGCTASTTAANKRRSGRKSKSTLATRLISSPTSARASSFMSSSARTSANTFRSSAWHIPNSRRSWTNWRR